MADSSKQYDLYIFDLDGTLAPFDSDRPYPDAAAWLREHPNNWIVATNQGGIGLRYWMERDNFGEPTKYPNLEAFEARLNRLFPNVAFDERKFFILMCAAYQSKTSGKWAPTPPSGVGYAMWNPDWRKPAPGMLLHAMTIRGVGAAQTVMIGDGPEDRMAAAAAGVDFIPDWLFFGRPEPRKESDPA